MPERQIDYGSLVIAVGEYSPTRYIEFVRSNDSPDEVITIYYGSRVNLITRGIIRSPRLTEPTPFPAGGFVPDPHG